MATKDKNRDKAGSGNLATLVSFSPLPTDANASAEVETSLGNEEAEVIVVDGKKDAVAGEATKSSNGSKSDEGSRDGVGDDRGDKEGKEAAPPSSLCFLYRCNRSFRRVVSKNAKKTRAVVLSLLLVGYLAFFAYCMYHEFGGEPSIRLLVGTVLGLLVLASRLLNGWLRCPKGLAGPGAGEDSQRTQLVRKIVRWSLYALAAGGAIVLIVVDVVIKQPRNLISLAGLILLLAVCFFASREPEKINWHAVFWGMSLQFWFAALIRKTYFGAAAFEWLADRFVEFLAYTDKGSAAVFGASYMDHRFVFQLMPTMIFFNAVISMLYYLGLVQVFIAKFGKFLSYCIGTSPIESVNAASNLLLTLSEAPILIKPFLKDITSSELFAVMTGGFASIAGSLLVAFSAYGAPINHILTASVMSAPAALAFAKLVYPDDRKPTVKAEDAYDVDVSHYGSVLGALSQGAKEGLKMAGYVVINLLIYVALLEFLDQTLLWFTERAGVEGFNFSRLLGYVFYPVTYIMGFETQDCFKAAQLLGIKIITTTTVTFMKLGTIITNGEQLENYIEVYNGTWSYVGDDVFLEATNTTLVGGVMSKRSGVLATYMVCGLSNLGAVGIAIGAFTSLEQSRMKEVIRTAPLALLAGNIASFSTACVAGLLLSD